jgi:hypothetical protein
MRYQTLILILQSCPDGGMVDAQVSGTCAARRGGSSPLLGTIVNILIGACRCLKFFTIIDLDYLRTGYIVCAGFYAGRLFILVWRKRRFYQILGV